MEDAPSLLKIPKSECPDIWIRLTFFARKVLRQLNPTTRVLVKGNAPGGRRQASGNKKREAHRSGASARPMHVHPCCRLQPGGLSPGTQAQNATRVQQEDEPGLWSLHNGLNRSTLHTVVSHCANGWLRPAGLGPNPPARGRARWGRRRPQGSPVGSW